jgi:ubiquinone/menaquinone biosynthesis C-methylase UbiE
MLISIMKCLHYPIYKLRLRGLLPYITTYLKEGDQVLDVGCGNGALGRAIMKSPLCPPRVKVTGLERIKRGNKLSPIEFYDGQQIPHPKNSFDVVILADVLHHEREPHHLIDECKRITRRLLIIKDHKIEGALAKQRISFMDWASNMQYGIPCLYRYNSAQEWTAWYKRHNLFVDHELHAMKIYPSVINHIFGGHLQYLAVLRKDGFKNVTDE